MDERRIVAIGGAGLAEQAEEPQLESFLLSLTRRERPRVCLIATASGDAEAYIAGFYRTFSRLDCRPSDLPLFKRTVSDLESFLLAQDLIYVGGGNTANMLAVWRVHGLDRILRSCWENGVVLGGSSAGMNCWFGESVTDSLGLERLTALHDGLALLPGSSCPHYDSEEERRPVFQRLVAAGELADGWAADERVALVFAGEELLEIVSARDGAGAYRVERTGDGAREQQLPARRLRA